VLTGPFSPLFGPFFRAKRAGPARLGPLRAGLGQKLKPAGTAGPARFWPGFTGPGPGRAGPFGHLYTERETTMSIRRKHVGLRVCSRKTSVVAMQRSCRSITYCWEACERGRISILPCRRRLRENTSCRAAPGSGSAAWSRS
jgi:hypothetical protein